MKEILNLTEHEMLVNIYCVNILPMLLSGLYPMSRIYCFLYVFIIWSSGRDEKLFRYFFCNPNCAKLYIPR